MKIKRHRRSLALSPQPTVTPVTFHRYVGRKYGKQTVSDDVQETGLNMMLTDTSSVVMQVFLA